MSATPVPQAVSYPVGEDGVRLVRLGTRRSALAMAQSGQVAARLTELAEKAGTPLNVELVPVVTKGDVTKASLATLGGTGVFVSALREALLAGEVDFVVHSLKDLPTAPAEGLTLAAVPTRADARDVLVARDGLTLGELPSGSRIGTGSPRRAAQLRALGLGLEVVDVRGNVDTRLGFVHDGVLDAVVLARAGLARLGREGEITETLDPLQMLPAPGQGALAIECREDDVAMLTALWPLDDPGTRAAVVAERALLATLEAGCAAPVGALAEVVEGEDGEEIYLRAVVAAVDGSVDLRRSATRRLGEALERAGEGGASIDAAAEIGRALAREMFEDGAAELMATADEKKATPQAGEGDL